MARYEGMDELLQRVQERLVETSAATERPQPDMRRPGTSHTQPDFYAGIVEDITSIRHRAQELREELQTGQIHSLSREQQHGALRLLREALQDLWSCESALDRVPQDT